LDKELPADIENYYLINGAADMIEKEVK